MTAKRPTLRLSILGGLADQPQPQTLIIFAEFQDNLVVERVQLIQQQVDGLTKKILNLRGYIEGEFPPFEEPSLKQFGGELLDWVIRGKVKRLFDMATEQSMVASKKERSLPLEIFVEDFDIAGWPWEYLYDSANKMFICQEFHPISRGIFTFIPRKAFPPKKGKVRILLVIAVPPDEPLTTPGEEVRLIEEVFERVSAKNVIEIIPLLAASPSDLEGKIRSGNYDVVHFFGHGGFDTIKREGYLNFKRSSTSHTRVYANIFGQMLAEHGIRLVFLNGCETARSHQKEDPARSSVAGALLDRGIPAVIANQFSMIDNSSHYLSSTIYSA